MLLLQDGLGIDDAGIKQMQAKASSKNGKTVLVSTLGI